MINAIITYILSDVSMWTIILALLLAFIHLRLSAPKKSLNAINLYLKYIFFLAIGVLGLWGFVMHCIFPDIAASFIGWENSPFQWEVGVANLGFGMCGIFAARASIGFQKSTALFYAVFLWGAGIGHIKQMIVQHNFTPGNAGAIFWTDMIVPIVIILFIARKQYLLNKID